jgi:hypothetical protein
MPKKKGNALLFGKNYTSGIAGLPYEDKGKILDAIYATAGAEYAVMPELSPLLRMAIAPILDGMKAAEAAYEKECERKRAAGAKGGKARVANLQSKQVQASPSTSKHVLDQLDPACGSLDVQAPASTCKQVQAPASTSKQVQHNYNCNYDKDNCQEGIYNILPSIEYNTASTCKQVQAPASKSKHVLDQLAPACGKEGCKPSSPPIPDDMPF